MHLIWHPNSGGFLLGQPWVKPEEPEYALKTETLWITADNCMAHMMTVKVRVTWHWFLIFFLKGNSPGHSEPERWQRKPMDSFTLVYWTLTDSMLASKHDQSFLPVVRCGLDSSCDVWLYLYVYTQPHCLKSITTHCVCSMKFVLKAGLYQRRIALNKTHPPCFMSG